MTPATELTARSSTERARPAPTTERRPADLTPGATIAGRYRVDRRIGAGATGEVWAGEHLSIGIDVAIKRLPPSDRLDRDTVARFKREAYLCGRIRSDSIARVLDLVEDEVYGMAIVMELIEGDPLATVLADGRLTPEEAIELAADIAEALAHLHHAHVVHRDLKPGNILMERTHDGRRRPVLVDFGASRMISAGDESGGAEDTLTSITRVDMAIGTLEYMAPEQILNARDVTASCDAYALGAILYRAVAGQHVYGALSQGKLVREKLVTDPPALKTGRTDPVARGLEAFVGQALQRHPRNRFQNGAAMVAELAKLRDLARAPSALLDETTLDEHDAIPFELVPRNAFAAVSSSELLSDDDDAMPPTLRRPTTAPPPPVEAAPAPPSPGWRGFVATLRGYLLRKK